MSTEAAIRLATADDVDAVFGLVQHLADSTGQQHRFLSEVQDFIKFGFSDDPQFEVLLAEQDGTVIGLSLFFYDFSSWRGELGVYIQDLVVDDEARARGTGRALLRATVQHAKQHGATHMRLSVEQDNVAAIGFYEALGLKESKNERIYAAFDGDFMNLAKKS